MTIGKSGTPCIEKQPALYKWKMPSMATPRPFKIASYRVKMSVSHTTWLLSSLGIPQRAWPVRHHGEKKTKADRNCFAVETGEQAALKMQAAASAERPEKYHRGVLVKGRNWTESRSGGA